MDALADFRGKDFFEQITILRDIEVRAELSALGDLLALHAAPLGDQSVDLAVTNVLQTLLMASETDTLAGLESPSPAVRRLCLRTVGKAGFIEAAPILARMAGRPRDADDLVDILTALAQLADPASAPVFRSCQNHADPIIETLCLEMIGILGDHASLPVLIRVIETAEAPENLSLCDLTTLVAARSAATLGGREALSYLTSKLHHKNPTARRVIHEGLISAGKNAAPLLVDKFASGDTDERILAANLLGEIGDKSGVEAMISALDQAAEVHPNIRFAVYEALGKTPSLKGLVYIMDGLAETDPMILLSVVTALDANVNPGVVKKVATVLKDGGGQAAGLARAIAGAEALRLFTALYAMPELSGLLVEAVCAESDPERRTAFAAALGHLDDPRAASDLARVRGAEGAPASRRVLAVDDSKAMLAFYRSTLPSLGLEAATAENGQVAWDIFTSGETFDLMIVDMNMPVMDGVELTRRIRAEPHLTAMPILMATTESESHQSDLARAAGVTAFLVKPFTATALEDALRSLLG